MTLFQNFRTMLGKRARYARTLRELRTMSNTMARDLCIDRDNAHTIARNAVYGA
ncbi:hypothetical protein [Tropicimonas aquimaris]|uniref:YjiS-like domain-containing protein n=1 Tax=Tropicimonas aquimaris TaxID=914152 RepID=A0ABW3IKI8_9RHOB